MSGTFILWPILILIVLFAILGLIAWALGASSTTIYYCTCPHPGVPCGNRVEGAGGICRNCASGDHSGHGR